MTENARPLAILVAVRLPDVDATAAEASLAELTRLVTTLGYQVHERVVQPRSGLSPAAVLGEGKLQELAKLTGGTGRTSPAAPAVPKPSSPAAAVTKSRSSTRTRTGMIAMKTTKGRIDRRSPWSRSITTSRPASCATWSVPPAWRWW
jgi:hypothetical protein